MQRTKINLLLYIELIALIAYSSVIKRAIARFQKVELEYA